MPRRKVTQLNKQFELLIGHSWEQAERIAEGATEEIRIFLPEGQTVADLLTHQLGLAERLAQERDRLTAIDDEHMKQLAIDTGWRKERDAAAAELRERALQLRDSLDGLFGAGGSFEVFQETPIIPIDPVALYQLIGRVRSNLGDEDFPLPKSLQTGFKLDRNGSVSDLEEPYQRLGEALRRLAASESNSKHSQSVKDAVIDEADVFVGRVFRYYEALYDLAGYYRLSDRLRRSSHRSVASRLTVGEGEPETGDPTGDATGDPATGDPENGSEPSTAAGVAGASD